MPGTVIEVSATFVASTTRRPAAGGEHPVLLGRASAARTAAGPSVARSSIGRSASATSWISRWPDRNTSTSPSPEVRHSRTASQTASTSSAGHVLGRPVADLDRVGAAADLDDRRAAEVRGEPLDVDGRAGDDHPQVGPARQQALEVAEQEVDVEAALVRLVDDDRVVAAQVAVALQLGEQDAVGHHLDPVPLAVRSVNRTAKPTSAPSSTPHSSAIRAASVRAAMRRGWVWPIIAGAAPARRQRDLGQLGGLARAGLAGDDDDLVVAQRRGDRLDVRGDRQVLGDAQPEGHCRSGPPGLRRGRDVAQILGKSLAGRAEEEAPDGRSHDPATRCWSARHGTSS